MALKKSVSANPQLAASLTAWAAKYNLAGDAYVSRLGASIEKGSGLEHWAEYDATDALPFPEVVPGAKEASLSEKLINFRNIMVFVPVAFTWAGISQATTAFSTYSELNPAKIVNFFDFWENGYGVLSEFWTLSNIARIDFLLLTLVIVASIAIAILQRISMKLQGAARQQLDQERLALALDINEYIFKYKVISPLILNQNVTGAIRDLRNATSSINKILKSSEKSAVELAKGSAIRQQLTTMTKLIEKLKN